MNPKAFIISSLVESVGKGLLVTMVVLMCLQGVKKVGLVRVIRMYPTSLARVLSSVDEMANKAPASKMDFCTCPTRYFQ